MTLTQAQRDEIRYAFEDAGMPEVLAFMAGQVADHDKKWVFQNSNVNPILFLCLWKKTPQGQAFWMQMYYEMETLK